MARRALATPQQAREASPDKASTRSREEGSACLLQTEFRRPRHFWLELHPPRRYLTGKPYIRFAPYCFGQMRPKRRHGRFGAMRVAPAVGPLAIKIVRMVGDTAHLTTSPSLTLFAVPEGQPYQCRRRVSAQFKFCGVRRRCDRAACGGLNAPRDVTAFRQRRPLPEEHSEKSNHNNPKDKFRVSRSKVLSREVSRPGSLMRNYSVSPASEPTSPDIDKDFLNRPLFADGRGCWRHRPSCGVDGLRARLSRRYRPEHFFGPSLRRTRLEST